VEAKTSDAALHHSHWSNSPYTAWRCVLGHCPVEKQITFPLSPNQIGWRIVAECCGSMLVVSGILNKSLTVSPAKHQHTICSMLHGGNHTCGDHPFTYSAAVGTKNLTFGHQTKGQISTSLMSSACVSWAKQVSSSYWCPFSSGFFSAIQP
jgi:hypothetical protein